MPTFLIPVDPVPCPRPRYRRGGGVYYPAKYNAFKAAMNNVMPSLAIEHGISGPMRGPVWVSMWIYVKKPKRTKLIAPLGDVDNYAKSVLDGCTGHLWVDDTQVLRLLVVKGWAEEGHSGSIWMEVVGHAE